MILVDNTAGPVEVTLPSAATVFQITIKDYGTGVGGAFTGNSSVNIITITPDGMDTIEGLANHLLDTTDGESITLVSDGSTNWAAI